ncbi:MAG: gamma-glutamyltranspeptidase/glutathione hydrolase [Paracoccaceae bacterium]|jgi:gamma-glutamyltranspeptidase/glutathione hydrolase
MRDFHQPGRSAVFAANGMCATSHPLATSTALEILKNGGNAVDAAIAGAVLLGICEPQMTGIGGDCFVLVKPAGGEDIVALNGSGRAPAASDAAALRAAGHKTISSLSAHSVTMPGAIDAFCKLSERFGTLGMPDLLAPATRYAREGVPVAPRVASDWIEASERLQGKAKELFLVNGEIPQTGQVFRAPLQVAALEAIAAHGRDGFYKGPVAEDIVACLRAAGGCHTLDDMANVESTWEEPISGPYRDLEVVEHPPNGQGAAALLLADIVAQFDVASMDPFGALRTHIEAEATKLAYDARNRFLADPAHMPDPNRLLDPELGAKLAALIDPKKAMGSPTALSESVHKETIYITVVDKNRMAVSLIYSIFDDFGSGLASDKFGILLHSRGAGFNLTEGHANELGANKRPMHTIIPGMLRQNGRVLMPFGVMGGPYQATGHARFVSNIADYGMDPQTAIDSPRAFAWDGELRLERGYAQGVWQELSDMGHKVTLPPTAIGGAQAIRIDPETGILEGASDPRKDGAALGY